MTQRLNWSALFHVFVVVCAIAAGHSMFGSYSGCWLPAPASVSRAIYFLVTRGTLILVITAVLAGVHRFLRYIVQEPTNPDVAGTSFYVTLPETTWLSYLGYRARLFMARTLSWLLFLRFAWMFVINITMAVVSLSYMSRHAGIVSGFVGCLNILFLAAQATALEVIHRFKVLDAVDDMLVRAHLAAESADATSIQNMVCDAACEAQERMHHQVLVTVNYAGNGSSHWFGYNDVVYFEVRARRANVSLVAVKIECDLGLRRRAADLHRIQNHIVDRLVTEIPMKFTTASVLK